MCHGGRGNNGLWRSKRCLLLVFSCIAWVLMVGIAKLFKTGCGMDLGLFSEDAGIPDRDNEDGIMLLVNPVSTLALASAAIIKDIRLLELWWLGLTLLKTL